MPIYEYGCPNCRRKQSVLVRSFSATVSPVCENCGNTELIKLISTFAVVRSEEDLMKGYDSMDWLYDLDPDDPEGLKKIKEWSATHGVENESPYSPDNAYQDDLGDVGFGTSPMGGFDDGLHGDFHGW